MLWKVSMKIKTFNENYEQLQRDEIRLKFLLHLPMSRSIFIYNQIKLVPASQIVIYNKYMIT